MNPSKKYTQALGRIVRKSQPDGLFAGYTPCDSIPSDVRMDVDRRTAGAIVTTSYGGHSRAEHGWGDPYMSIHDASTGNTRRFVWVEAPELHLDPTPAYSACGPGASYRMTLGDHDVEISVDETAPATAATDAVMAAVSKLADRWNARCESAVETH